MDEWISKHSLQVKAPAFAVAAELFECCVRTHQNTMDEAASASTVEAHAEQLQRTGVAIALLRLLWFTSKYSAAIRTPQRFRQVVGTFRHWAHFDLNANDRAQREAERALLNEMIAAIDDPTGCLALLEPWGHDDFQDNAATLTEQVTDALTERASEGALHRFGVASGVSSMFRSKMYAAEYVLTRATPTWADARRGELVALAAAHPQVVAENVRLFAENIVEPNSFGDAARTLLADRSLVELWWQLITAVRWQARFFRGLEKLKTALEGDAPLPPPSWWEEERETAYRTPIAQASTPERDDGHDHAGGEDHDEESNDDETELANV